MSEDDDQQDKDLAANRAAIEACRAITQRIWKPTSTPARAERCVTHHHACDCIEHRRAETIKAALHHLDLMEPGNLAHQRAQVAHLLRSLLPNDA